MLDNVELESDGAFSAVGNYPCSELMTLVGAFSDHTGHSVQFLQTAFGKWIFAKFAESYQVFFEGKDNAFTMLESIENEVHVEVRKLYPEVELPTFATNRLADGSLEMIYSSERPLVDFCQGMIEACLEHFGEQAEITQTKLQDDNLFGAKFNIRLQIEQAA